MGRVCESCFVCNTERCPYHGGTIPDEVIYGCYHYIKATPPHNYRGKATKCATCRYFFRKSREESSDKSFIMCGAIPSLTQRIAPVPHCPNYKPLRRKQRDKRKLK